MKQAREDVKQILSNNVTFYQDFPEKGILFKDLNPVYQNHKSFSILIEYMASLSSRFRSIDYIIGIEARGFILGSALAQKLKCGFIPLRKKGKLPGEVKSIKYSLEYGTDCLEMQVNSSLKESRVLLIDDVFATGGTAKAAISLLKTMASYVAIGIILDIGLCDINTLETDYFVVLDN
ncbi:MAG: adenine phosphoribosyltransferase [bacterium]|nr:adenine phosphoribosyltransferase [bacterium]